MWGFPATERPVSGAEDVLDPLIIHVHSPQPQSFG